MPDPDEVRLWVFYFVVAVILVAAAWVFISSAISSPGHPVQMVPVGGDPCSLDCGITRSAASSGSSFARASTFITVARH